MPERWWRHQKHPSRDTPLLCPSFLSEPWNWSLQEQRFLLGLNNNERISPDLETGDWCTFKLHSDFRLSSIAHHFERPQFHVLLDLWIVILPADQSFRIKYRVTRVHGDLVLSSISDQPFGIRKSHITWGCSISCRLFANSNFLLIKSACPCVI